MRFYHTTRVSLVNKILTEGLKPSSGISGGLGSLEYEDLRGKVYLGRDREESWANLENARGLTKWELEGIGLNWKVLTAPHALLEVDLPETFPVELTQEGEFYTSVTVPPEFIKVLRVEKQRYRLKS